MDICGGYENQCFSLTPSGSKSTTTWCGGWTVSSSFKWLGSCQFTDFWVVFTTTFFIPDNVDISLVYLSGSWSCDDQCSVYINGNFKASLGPSGMPYERLFPFSVNSGFRTGINTLSWTLLNPGGGRRDSGNFYWRVWVFHLRDYEFTHALTVCNPHCIEQLPFWEVFEYHGPATRVQLLSCRHLQRDHWHCLRMRAVPSWCLLHFWFCHPYTVPHGLLQRHPWSHQRCSLHCHALQCAAWLWLRRGLHQRC